MTAIEHGAAALERCCLGNPEAKRFLIAWSQYVHAIDDLIDGAERPAPEALLQTFAKAIAVYSDPFYLQHIEALRQVAVSATNLYADSVAWEQSPMPWHRHFADWARHAGAEMVLAVAHLCGGYEHMRSLSLELRTICYLQHHDLKGDAV